MFLKTLLRSYSDHEAMFISGFRTADDTLFIRTQKQWDAVNPGFGMKPQKYQYPGLLQSIEIGDLEESKLLLEMGHDPSWSHKDYLGGQNSMQLALTKGLTDVVMLLNESYGMSIQRPELKQFFEKAKPDQKIMEWLKKYPCYESIVTKYVNAPFFCIWMSEMLKLKGFEVKKKEVKAEELQPKEVKPAEPKEAKPLPKTLKEYFQNYRKTNPGAKELKGFGFTRVCKCRPDQHQHHTIQNEKDWSVYLSWIEQGHSVSSLKPWKGTVSESKLICALHDNSPKGLKESLELLDMGHDPFERYENGTTIALHFAIQEHHWPVVQKMVNEHNMNLAERYGSEKPTLAWADDEWTPPNVQFLMWFITLPNLDEIMDQNKDTKLVKVVQEFLAVINECKEANRKHKEKELGKEKEKDEEGLDKSKEKKSVAVKEKEKETDFDKSQGQETKKDFDYLKAEESILESIQDKEKEKEKGLNDEPYEMVEKETEFFYSPMNVEPKFQNLYEAIVTAELFATTKWLHNIKKLLECSILTEEQKMKEILQYKDQVEPEYCQWFLTNVFSIH